MHLNKVLRIAFIAAAVVFLYFFLTTPKTDCQACRFQYEGDVIDGYEAFEIFEETCISYRSPTSTEPLYVDIDNINVTEINGIQVLEIDEKDVLVKYDGNIS